MGQRTNQAFIFFNNNSNILIYRDIDPMEFILGENLHSIQGRSNVESNVEQSMLRQTYSRLSTMYCMLTDYYKVELSTHSFKSLNLESLALKWMDPSYEIREAAQTLLKNELKRIGPNGRANLIKIWEPHLTSLLKDFDDLTNVNVQQQQQQQNAQQIQSQPQGQTQLSLQYQHQQQQMVSSQQSNHQQHQPQQQQPQQQQHSSQQSNDQNEYTGSIDSSLIAQIASHSNRIKRKQYVSIIILSLIGAEFGQDVNSNKAQMPYKTIPQGFSLEDHSILKRISNYL